MVDASALLEYLLQTEAADRIRAVLRLPEADLHVPALCDVEIAAGIRRALLQQRVSLDRAASALEDYLDLSLTRHGHQALLARMLALRENLSAYDACYVALSERLSGQLLTADERLSRAVQRLTDIRVLP